MLRRDNDAPISAKSSKATEAPTRPTPNRENAAPKRATDLNAKVEANALKSNTDREDPMRIPHTEIADPIRAQARRESVLPKVRLSRIAKVDPKRPMPNNANAEPRRPKLRSDS